MSCLTMSQTIARKGKFEKANKPKGGHGGSRVGSGRHQRGAENSSVAFEAAVSRVGVRGTFTRTDPQGAVIGELQGRVGSLVRESQQKQARQVTEQNKSELVKQLAIRDARIAELEAELVKQFAIRDARTAELETPAPPPPGPHTHPRPQHPSLGSVHQAEA